ncbi:MAG: hypothetical protein JWP85_2479 [Rhodoglobus sp.]|nr:hypothetical protein [Rhodoglobus sp.]
MTSSNDRDPGWWHRGMSRRAQIIVVAVAVAVLIVAGIVIAVNGIALF